MAPICLNVTPKPLWVASPLHGPRPGAPTICCYLWQCATGANKKTEKEPGRKSKGVKRLLKGTSGPHTPSKRPKEWP